MKKVLFFFLPAIICCLSCIKDDPNKNKVYAFIPNSSTTERWETDKKYIQEASALYEIELTVKTYDENSQASLQVEDVKNAIADGIRYFILTPIDYYTFNEAKVFEGHNDLKIVCHDRMIYNNASVNAYSSCDGLEVGALQAKYVIAQLMASGKDSMTMEILAGPASDNNSVQLFDGAWNELKPYVDNGSLKIVSGKKTFAENALTEWSATAANQAMNDRLKDFYPGETYPDIIICPNDNCAYGAILAVASHSPGTTKYPIVTGQDNTAEAAALIKQGKMSMTVEKSLRDMAYNSVATLVNLMRNVEPTTSYYFDNGARYVPFIKATPKAITAESFE